MISQAYEGFQAGLADRVRGEVTGTKRKMARRIVKDLTESPNEREYWQGWLNGIDYKETK